MEETITITSEKIYTKKDALLKLMSLYNKPIDDERYDLFNRLIKFLWLDLDIKDVFILQAHQELLYW